MRPILSRVGASLDRTEAKQSDALDALSSAAENESDHITDALTAIGANAAGPADEASEPEGGPFIPAAGLHFVERAALLRRTLDGIESLRQSAKAMPLGAPVKALYFSSRFGYRIDPFLKRPAFHAGLDFVAEDGTVVRATAAGTVVSAGWNGGYGEMVEIKHADGVSTRYGHLSEILVSRGMHVDAGTPIGRVGSTGRSTGPHLHYETRRDGRPSTRRSTSPPERRCAAAPSDRRRHSSGGHVTGSASNVSRMKPDVFTHFRPGRGRLVRVARRQIVAVVVLRRPGSARAERWRRSAPAGRVGRAPRETGSAEVEESAIGSPTG